MAAKWYSLIVGLLLILLGVLQLLDIEGFAADMWLSIVLLIIGVLGLVVGITPKKGGQMGQPQQ